MGLFLSLYFGCEEPMSSLAKRLSSLILFLWDASVLIERFGRPSAAMLTKLDSVELVASFWSVDCWLGRSHVNCWSSLGYPVLFFC